MDLTALEYPRHLHKPDWAFLHVDTPEQAEKALAEGWSLTPVLDASPEAAPVPPAPPHDAPVAPKKGKKK